MFAVLKRSKMLQITVIGSTVADIIFVLPRLLANHAVQTGKIELGLGEKLRVPSQVFSGGTGANLAVGLSKLGAQATFLTCFGDDALGKDLLAELTAKQVKVKGRVIKQQTPLSLVLVAGNDRTILASPSDYLSNLPTKFPQKNWIHLGSLPNEAGLLYQKLISHLVKTNQPISFNPSLVAIQERERAFLSLLRLVKVLFVNRQEASVLSRLNQRLPLEEFLKPIHRLGVETICLTDGEKGAIVSSSQIIFRAAALTACRDRIDATGAGDAFASGFLFGLLIARSERLSNEESLEQALRYAIANSGSVVSQLGAQKGLLDLQQIKKDGKLVKITKDG